jgi:hypothetical protein
MKIIVAGLAIFISCSLYAQQKAGSNQWKARLDLVEHMSNAAKSH